MANYADRPDRSHGALFINNRKEKDGHPDLQGNMEITKALFEVIKQQFDSGKETAKVDLSAWTKQGPKAGKYLSVQAERPWEKSANAPPDTAKSAGRMTSHTPPPPEVSDDKIPF